KLLRPVARNAAADGEDSEALLTEQGCGKALQVFERIEAESRLPLLVAFTVGQREIQPQLGIGERGNKYRDIFLVGRLQNAALSFGVLRQMRPNRAVQLIRAHRFVRVPAP